MFKKASLKSLMLFTLIVAISVFALNVSLVLAADRGPWAPNVAYAVNDTVTYGGVVYKCIQAHTSQVTWEPPNVPALWGVVGTPTSGGGATNTPTNTSAPPTNTPTRTNTPVGPTNTPTNTSVGPTNTPTNTSPAPTNTPTRTNTPVGPTNTPTNTSVPSGNLALNKPATASSVESGTSFTANLAVDGNTGTRWSSNASDPQWLRVDLGSTSTLSRVVLRWEAAYGKSYQIQTSTDDVNWTNIYSTTTGDGGVDDLTGLSGSGRYVRMYGTVRGTQWGYSLWELEVYGTGGPTNTPGPSPTPTNTSVVPTNTPTNTAVPPTPTRTNTPVGPTATPCASCGLPTRVMVGYWHNFDNGSGFIRLRNVSTKWNVIIVAFGEPTSPTSGTIVFTPFDGAAEFSSDLAYLHSLGKKVLLSIGGANGTVQLTSTGARDAFVSSVTSIINTYGFDGLDIDFEGQSLILNSGDSNFMNPTTPVIVNTISAIRSVRNNFGSNFILTMAPETFFVQLGYQFYGGTCSGCDRRAGAFLPVIYGTRDILTWLQVQDYNSGPIMGLDNTYYNMGSPDFHSAMLDMTLTNFVVAGTGLTFPALRPDQVVLGVPATVNAGNGYMTPTEVQKALNYIIKGQSYGGAYVKRNTVPTPNNLRGVMTWSVNWDAYNGIFEFSNSYRTYLDGLP
jgi:chitinase